MRRASKPRAHHVDPLGGGDETAGLVRAQELHRGLEHLVHLRVGQALDLDEALLGNSQEGLDGAVARLLDFLRG